MKLRKRKRKKLTDRKSGGRIWRSYADMMSGLLLLFILIMAVCLLQAQKNYTEKLAEQAKLLKSQTELEESQKKVDEQESEIIQKESEIAQKESEISEKESEMENQRMTLAEQATMLEESKKALENKQTALDEKESEISSQQDTLNEKESEIEQQREEIKQKESELTASQEELDKATELVYDRQIELDDANDLMKKQQEQIDQIIGIKAGIIEELNEEFKDAELNVDIDKETGAIVLDASVLYDFGKSNLTKEGERILYKVLPVYCKVLLSPDHINDVAEIIIDGYTDSVGDYKTNLLLSQDRAMAVANYLLDETSKELSKEEQDLLKSKLSVNGRSSSNLILDKNGKEDADASRRVEVKFRLKDEEMIAQLQEIIDKAGQETRNPENGTEAEEETKADIMPAIEIEDTTETEE